jgi:hypothetical protein
MFSFEETKGYNSTISQFCEEINVGRNKFYVWLRDKEILDYENEPNIPYKNYFIPYDTTYSVYSYQADPSNGAQADPLNGAKLTP